MPPRPAWPTPRSAATWACRAKHDTCAKPAARGTQPRYLSRAVHADVARLARRVVGARRDRGLDSIRVVLVGLPPMEGTARRARPWSRPPLLNRWCSMGSCTTGAASQKWAWQWHGSGSSRSTHVRPGPVAHHGRRMVRSRRMPHTPFVCAWREAFSRLSRSHCTFAACSASSRGAARAPQALQRTRYATSSPICAPRSRRGSGAESLYYGIVPRFGLSPLFEDHGRGRVAVAVRTTERVGGLAPHRINPVRAGTVIAESRSAASSGSSASSARTRITVEPSSSTPSS